VRTPLLESEPAAECGEPALGHLPGLVENALLEPGQACLHKPDRARHKRRNAQQRTVHGRGLDAACYRGFWRCERDDLDRGDHLLGFDRREWRQRAERHRLVDQIEPVEPFRIEHQKSPRLGEEIGAAREWGRRFDIRPGCGRSDPPGGLVLADIAGFEPGDHDPRQARGSDQLDIGMRQHPRLFQRRCPELEAVREDRPFGLGDGDLAELHAASAASP
jgi:hypothetical protein